MHEALGGWENFYVIIGSSGAALIGLQFVVIALVNDARSRNEARAAGSNHTISAFGTPTVVHLAGALVISAIMSAPWPSLAGMTITLTACGVIGMLYGIVVIRHARGQTEYKPVMEDWLWHVVLPDIAYATLTVAALAVHAAPMPCGFLIGASALALLLIGIHNAWDTVTYLVVGAES